MPMNTVAPIVPEHAPKPFVVEMERLDEDRAGYFRPGARLTLTPALHVSGLWRDLPPEEFKNLLLVLTFVTPNGWCRPTAPQLAAAMNTSEAKARARLERLAQTRWRERPLVTEMKRESGLDAWVPAETLLEVREAPPAPAVAPSYHPAGREAILSYSRSRYARPRAEVERQIAALAGWDLPGGAASAAGLPPEEFRPWLSSRLLRLGVPQDEAARLLAAHEPERILRQVEWLPFRNAKSPARFLVAAIEGDYEPPAGVRPVAVPPDPAPQDGTDVRDADASPAEAGVDPAAPDGDAPTAGAATEEGI